MTWERFWELNVVEWAKTPFNFLKFNYIVEEINNNPATICPAKENIFKAFRLTPPSNLKVVILLQDPYHDKNRATGLSLANFNEDHRAVSPSLKIVWNCVEREFYNGLCLDFDFSLESWAKQGVLLLNTALSVEAGKPGSHIRLWSLFTEDLIKFINKEYPETIFILWGKYAEQYEPLCNNVLKYSHPAHALYTHTNWNCKNFKEANDILINQGKEPIKW